MKNNEIINTDNLIPQDFPFNIAWKNYKETNKNIAKNKKLLTEADFKRIVKDCLKAISHYWTHSTGGVYVKGFGYLTVFRPDIKLSINDIERVLKTNGYMYITYHDTTLKKTDSWGGFNIKVLSLDVKSQLTNNINNDRRYTINTPILREYLKKRKYI